jgi:hypothetical protein
MKPRHAPTEFWRFPITGEETWAGVDLRHAQTPGDFYQYRRSDHDTPTQQFTQLTPLHP